MDSLIFIGTIACLGLILAWYFANDLAGAPGTVGLLAILGKSPDNSGLSAPAYRIKDRRFPGAKTPARGRAAAVLDPSPALAFRPARDKAAYEPRSEARYHSKGTPPRYSPRRKS